MDILRFKQAFEPANPKVPNHDSLRISMKYWNISRYFLLCLANSQGAQINGKNKVW
jgi:hypothetical protein